MVAGVKIGASSRLPSTQPGRQRDAADLAGGGVVEQAGPGQVAAGDALDGVHVEPLADHGATARRRRGRRSRRRGRGTRSAQLLEPPQRHPGQDLALVGDRRGEDEVEDRDPVAGHHQQVAGVRALGELVEVTHLAGVEVARTLDRRGRGDVQHGTSLGTSAPDGATPAGHGGRDAVVRSRWARLCGLGRRTEGSRWPAPGGTLPGRPPPPRAREGSTGAVGKRSRSAAARVVGDVPVVALVGIDVAGGRPGTARHRRPAARCRCRCCGPSSSGRSCARSRACSRCSGCRCRSA